MRQMIWNQGERIVSGDLNAGQLLTHRSLLDDIFYPLLGSQDGVIASSFTLTYTSALVASLESGTGFIWDSTQAGDNSRYRQIIVESNQAVNFTTAHASLNRIDRVCIAPSSSVTDTQQRYVKTAGTGPISLTTLDKRKKDTYTIQVVAGTPSGSPAVPSLPTGYIAVANVLIVAATGMTSQSNITDTRNVVDLDLVGVRLGLAGGGTTSTSGGGTRTITVADYGKVVLIDTSTGAETVYLPAPSTAALITIKDSGGKADISNITLVRYSAEKIEGIASDYVVSAAWWTATIVSNGTDWFLI